jgi:hypothetical protein
MGADSGNFSDSTKSRYAKMRGFLVRLWTLVGQLTFKIKQGTPDETVADIGKKSKLDDKQRQFLIELGGTKAGAAFIKEKVREINREAFHRSAFALNAFTQLGFVDLAAQLSLSLPLFKLALVAANLILAGIAHAAMRHHLRALLAGPSVLPPRRRLGGLLRNRKYNKAVKKSSRPYARSAWKEKSVYRPAYFMNALTIFLGSQFVIPPEKLIFPLGFLVGKLSGLLSTLVMVFDVWRGVRAGEDARIAREKEVSVYRDLDI